MSAPSDLLQRIRETQARIGIIGLGYVGLPLAVEFAKAGFDVTGFDVDESKIQQINAGDSYIPDVPAPELAHVVRSGTLRATRLRSCGRPLRRRGLQHAASPPRRCHPRPSASTGS
jgi:2-polyprenyl-6-methoxyphenol hydroxylase-like FAD-dependent oxidoreductase